MIVCPSNHTIIISSILNVINKCIGSINKNIRHHHVPGPRFLYSLFLLRKIIIELLRETIYPSWGDNILKRFAFRH